MSENHPRPASADQPRPGTPAPGRSGTRPGTPDGTATPAAGTGAPASAGERPGRDTGGRGRGKQPSATRPGSDWGTFRAVVIAVGVVLAAVGAYFLITGTHGLPNASTGPFEPTLESQFRFFAALEIGVGAAFIAIAVKFRWVEVLWLVCMMVFFGGVGRVISWAIVGGTPHWLMIVLMIVELAFPAALLVWHRWITKTVDLKRSLVAGR
ncbi:hypothetical protein GCM10011512_29600 [Tersicoccus solisilvae]|uniref:DUF4345 domain-containing protein n=1 Tax=Tersicoccus solisilvae TaxID=1882339 RepID=A0ABQ1PQ56_9MICC|nr:DUF4345 domain-containing protein [Tersicoccus solisilvae]GGD00828.1 hypothetical protein GCM10011512_29600 [Tersicoccus solisilvae]